MGTEMESKGSSSPQAPAEHTLHQHVFPAVELHLPRDTCSRILQAAMLMRHASQQTSSWNLLPPGRSRSQARAGNWLSSLLSPRASNHTWKSRVTGSGDLSVLPQE